MKLYKWFHVIQTNKSAQFRTIITAGNIIKLCLGIVIIAVFNIIIQDGDRISNTVVRKSYHR